MLLWQSAMSLHMEHEVSSVDTLYHKEQSVGKKWEHYSHLKSILLPHHRTSTEGWAQPPLPLGQRESTLNSVNSEWNRDSGIGMTCLLSVWKHECRPTRKGWLDACSNTCFSVWTQSMSCGEERTADESSCLPAGVSRSLDVNTLPKGTRCVYMN